MVCGSVVCLEVGSVVTCSVEPVSGSVDVVTGAVDVVTGAVDVVTGAVDVVTGSGDDVTVSNDAGSVVWQNTSEAKQLFLHFQNKSLMNR